jgi:oxalate decarboxylase/phosphoglucose isomerase-like protein (cupin superfamily)
MYVPKISPTAALVKEGDKPRIHIFSLKAPYMKEGRITQLVAETPKLRISTKVNAKGGGGENELHTHLNEDHAFVVLEGQMSVFDEEGNEFVLKQYQGALLPSGAFYRYHNSGDGNMVVLRIGHVERDKNRGTTFRVNPKGQVAEEGTVENKWVEPVEDEIFFAPMA